MIAEVNVFGGGCSVVPVVRCGCTPVTEENTGEKIMLFSNVISNHLLHTYMIYICSLL